MVRAVVQIFEDYPDRIKRSKKLKEKGEDFGPLFDNLAAFVIYSKERGGCRDALVQVLGEKTVPEANDSVLAFAKWYMGTPPVPRKNIDKFIQPVREILLTPIEA